MIYLVIAGALVVLAITVRAGINQEDLAYFLMGYFVWACLGMGLVKAFQYLFLGV